MGAAIQAIRSERITSMIIHMGVKVSVLSHNQLRRYGGDKTFCKYEEQMQGDRQKSTAGVSKI